MLPYSLTWRWNERSSYPLVDNKLKTKLAVRCYGVKILSVSFEFVSLHKKNRGQSPGFFYVPDLSGHFAPLYQQLALMTKAFKQAPRHDQQNHRER